MAIREPGSRAHLVRRIVITLIVAPVLAVAGVASPAAAVTYNIGYTSCNSGYEAQTVAYHRNTVQHGQFTGSTWSFTNKNTGATWGYSYDGRGTQSFTQGTIYGTSTSDLSSVVSSRCA
jgi:hypothetical protein